jgi:hypothetical protein
MLLIKLNSILNFKLINNIIINIINIINIYNYERNTCKTLSRET